MAQRGPQMLRIGLERQHQARHAGVIEGSLDSVLAAFALDLLDAPTPRLDVAGAEERAREQGVERTRRMLCRKSTAPMLSPSTTNHGPQDILTYQLRDLRIPIAEFFPKFTVFS